MSAAAGELLTSVTNEASTHGVDTNERSVSDLRQRGLDVPSARPGVLRVDRGPHWLSAGHVRRRASGRRSSRLPRVCAGPAIRRLLMIETPNAEPMAMSVATSARPHPHPPRHPAALTVPARATDSHRRDPRGPPAAGKERISSTPRICRELQRVIHASNDRLFALARPAVADPGESGSNQDVGVTSITAWDGGIGGSAGQGRAESRSGGSRRRGRPCRSAGR